MTQRQDILDIRNNIDRIDNSILKLLLERINLAQKIGKLKSDGNRAKWDPLREREIYERLLNENNGVFPDESLKSIFHEIITTCRLSQHKATVGYLGPEATFSHLAGVKYFGHSAHYKPLETIADVFAEVEKGRIQYGIVPVENSIEGAVSSTLDSFMKYKIKICGEMQLAINHNLVSKSGNLSDIKKVISHSQPLAQCREWLRKHLPDAETLPVFSSALAAQMAVEDDSVGAIASSLAVTRYNLQLAVKGIEDYQGNTTRFLIIGKESPVKSGQDRTSLLIGTMDKPGSLSEVLNTLSEEGINLAKIESRPIKGKHWKYLFFLDMIGHIEDDTLKKGCARLKEQCSYFEWLGSYPIDEHSTEYSATNP